MKRTVAIEDVEMLQEIIEESGLRVIEGYCGRGRSTPCVAVAIERDLSERAAIANLIDACSGDLERTDILSHALRGSLVDGMGTGSVLYFPRYTEDGDDS